MSTNSKELIQWAVLIANEIPLPKIGAGGIVLPYRRYDRGLLHEMNSLPQGSILPKVPRRDLAP